MLAKRHALLAGVAGACLWAGLPARAWAQDPPSTPSTPSAPASEAAESDAGEGAAHALTFAIRAGNPGYGGLVGYRRRLRHGIGIGVEVEGVFAPEGFIAGYKTERNAAFAARVPLLFPVYRSRSLTMALTFAPGVQVLQSFEPGSAPQSQGVSVTADVGAFAYLRAGPRLTWMAGINTLVSVQASPIVDVNTLGTLLVTGPVVPINDRLSWFATAEAGGIFGSDGDAGKFLVRGTSGLRVMFGASARQWRAF